MRTILRKIQRVKHQKGDEVFKQAPIRNSNGFIAYAVDSASVILFRHPTKKRGVQNMEGYAQKVTLPLLKTL